MVFYHDAFDFFASSFGCSPSQLISLELLHLWLFWICFLISFVSFVSVLIIVVGAVFLLIPWFFAGLAAARKCVFSMTTHHWWLCVTDAFHWVSKSIIAETHPMFAAVIVLLHCGIKPDHKLHQSTSGIYLQTEGAMLLILQQLWDWASCKGLLPDWRCPPSWILWGCQPGLFPSLKAALLLHWALPFGLHPQRINC